MSSTISRPWLAATLLLLAGCATNATQLTSVWRDPAVATYDYKQIVTVCMCKDEGFRREVEDELAQYIKNAVPSYKALSESEVRDPDAARARLQAEQFDAAVIMRLVAVDKEEQYVPGQTYAVAGPYGPAYGYWGYGWTTAYSPGYVITDKIVSVQTNVYSLKDGKLVWVSRSKSTNPETIKQLVGEIVEVTAMEMDKQHVLPGKKKTS
jgi:hypothetical protein